MSCDNCRILSKIDSFRFVGQCQPETFHIAWDTIMLRLQQLEFRRLVSCLEQGLTNVDLGEIRDEPFCRLVQQENGCYQIWLRSVLISLTTAEFLTFAKLLRQAWQKKDCPTGPTAF